MTPTKRTDQEVPMSSEIVSSHNDPCFERGPRLVQEKGLSNGDEYRNSRTKHVESVHVRVEWKLTDGEKVTSAI